MQIRARLLAAVAAAFLASCGGGGSEPLTSSVGITSVKVMGDSLADSGTFEGLPGYGRIFSVQGSDSEPNVIWTERTAAVLGTPQLCNFFQYTGTAFTVDSACSSYGVGGGRINNKLGAGGEMSPFSIVYQMATAASVNKAYSASDLLLIDGGGNDAADLVGAYLKAGAGDVASYRGLLVTVLDSTLVDTTLATDPNGAAVLGGAYMQALADQFYGAIKTYGLDLGAQRVAVLNMPGITNTPRFQLVLASIEAAKGTAARDQAEALFRSWITTFNQRLSANVGTDPRVVVVDFFKSFDDQVNNPAQYGLTNVTTPACPIVAVSPAPPEGDGLPIYNFQTCTADALSAAPPAGVTDPNWWKTYAFADGFHPTPYGYQLLGQLVAKSLATAGWL